MQKHPIIGVVTTMFEFPTYDAICAEIRRRGGLTLGFHGLVDSIAAARLSYDVVDGWIVMGRPEQVELLRESGRPVVLCSSYSPSVDSVTIDSRAGTHQVMRHLIDQGHTRIAFIGYDMLADFRARREAYVEELQAAGLEVDPALTVDASGDVYGDGYAAVQRLIDAGGRFTAIYASNDWLAIEALKCLKANGLRVPEDVALVGFDDLWFVRFTTPPISSVRQYFDAIGTRTVEVLFDRMARPGATPAVEYVNGDLVARASSLRAQGDRLLAAPPAPDGDWRAQLARDLVSLVIAPQPLGAGTTPEQIWPGVTGVVQSLASALAGPDAALVDTRAWGEAWEQLPDPNRIGDLLDRLQLEVLLRVDSGDHGQALRCSQWLRGCRDAIDSYRIQELVGQDAHYHAILDTTLALMNQLNDPGGSIASLSWLRAIDSAWGAMALWEGGTQPAPQAGVRLQVPSIYTKEAGASPGDRRYAPSQFPPRAWVEEAYASGHSQILKVIAIATQERHLGYMLYCENLTHTQIETINHRKLYITASIEREQLVQSLTERQGTLLEAYEREQRLSATIRELGCPLIPLIPGVLLVPLIGTLDEQRASQIIETILEGVSREQARHVLLDITGVPLIDTHVAAALMRTAQAVGLLGARIALVGVRPEIAQSIVSLGINLGRISTYATLASALRYLLQSAGDPAAGAR